MSIKLCKQKDRRKISIYIPYIKILHTLEEHHQQNDFVPSFAVRPCLELGKRMVLTDSLHPPYEIEGCLGGGNDVEGDRHGETFSKVIEVELGAGELPLHVRIILNGGRGCNSWIRKNPFVCHPLPNSLGCRAGSLTSIFWKELVIMAISMLRSTMTMIRVKMPYSTRPTNSATTKSGMSTYSWFTTPNIVQKRKRKVSLNLEREISTHTKDLENIFDS